MPHISREKHYLHAIPNTKALRETYEERWRDWAKKQEKDFLLLCQQLEKDGWSCSRLRIWQLVRKIRKGELSAEQALRSLLARSKQKHRSQNSAAR